MEDGALLAKGHMQRFAFLPADFGAISKWIQVALLLAAGLSITQVVTTKLVEPWALLAMDWNASPAASVLQSLSIANTATFLRAVQVVAM
jgi:hypothetical protein